MLSFEAGGRVQRGSLHSFLLCMIGNFHDEKLEKREVPVKHRGRGVVEPNPRQRWGFCCSKSRGRKTQVLKSMPRAQGSQNQSASEPSCLPRSSRLEFSWDCPRCSWNLQSVPSTPFSSQNKAFYNIPSVTCSFLCTSRLQWASKAQVMKMGFCLNNAQCNYATWESIIIT